MPTSEGNALTLVINGPIVRDDLPGLYRRVCGLLESGDTPVAFCEVERVNADAVTVDALARLQLAALRHGCQIRLQGASNELRELVGLMGLDAVLPD